MVLNDPIRHYEGEYGRDLYVPIYLQNASILEILQLFSNDFVYTFIQSPGIHLNH